MGSSVAVVRAYRKGIYYKGAYYEGAYYKKTYHKGACCKESSINNRVVIRGRVGISGKVSIEVSFSKDRALFIIYSREVGK